MIIVFKDSMAMGFVTTTKNIASGFCDMSKCTIVMAVINVLYDYKCSHIFHILA